MPQSSPVAAPARPGVHVMTKPIGPICNLDCAYCYYLQKEELYPGTRSWRMPLPTLEAYIEQYIDAQSPATEEIEFAWQGGEPTLLGVEFFERVVELQQKYAPAGKRCRNALQTNGVLLDDRWCELFKQHEFLIGLSIDGPQELHDLYRYDKRGQGTFDEVMRGLKLLQKHKVEYNTLTVVHRGNGSHGRKIYRFLRQLGVEFMQFIPIVEPLPAEQVVMQLGESSKAAAPEDAAPEDLVTERTVRPRQFGKFLMEVFDEWLERDVGRIFVQIFDQALAAHLGLEPTLCVFKAECGRALALEHNGDLYSCDHFVLPEYKLGNIHELPIVELANSPAQQAFGEAKRTTLPEYCRQCDVHFICHGECPKNRFLTTPDGEAGLNYLCGGYMMFFRHIGPVMKAMAYELSQGRPAANVMRSQQQAARQPTSQSTQRGPTTAPRRNDPCPCGSGRKYKQCCLRAR